MDRSEDDTMLAELRELRPEPRPEFTAELDEWAAAGFPRRTSAHARTTPFSRLAARWRAMSLRRRLIPAFGFALTAVVVATVVIAATGGSGGSSDLMTSATSSGSTSAGTEVGGAGGAEASREVLHAEGNLKLPEHAAHTKASKGEFNGNFFGESGEESEVEAEPEEEGGKNAGESAPAESAEAEESFGSTEPEAIPAVPPAEPSVNSARSHRDIERSAAIVLGTKPGEVAAASAQVYKAVHAANGVVLNSSVQSGRAGPTGASFSLLIPSRKLDDALAAFSQIAEVRSRHDATDDITAPTVGVTEELRDSNASIEGLLKALGDVETESELESVEARLREERRHHAAIRASLDNLHKRASMSEVSVRIVTDHGAGVTPPASGSGNWGVGDALHDAGHILTIAAGVVLIGLAVLAPIALIALLFWAGNRFRVRRLRERTLG